MRELSIHRALSELKVLDKRIQKAYQKNFITMQIGSSVPDTYSSVEEFETEAKASLDQVTQLIKNRNEIKAAIVKSNAETEVVIAGQKMTVAEAIDRRDSGIEYDKNLLSVLKHQLSKMVVSLERENQNFEDRLEKRLASDINPKDKGATKEIEVLTESYTKRYKPTMLDPISIREKIKELEEKVESFELEVDFTLSESNANTKIQIED